MSEFVGALHAAARRLNEWAVQLGRTDGWSSGASAFEVDHFTTDGHAAISGYVEGERESGTFAWLLDVIREGDTWLVDRSLALNAKASSDQEVVAQLREVRFVSTRQLAGELPQLVDELLDLPVPD